ncbi:hypothetical protein DHW03_17410 [Pedobacter yonginense]|uniref:DUF2768 domain-containing protein n=1 Tax=Pedobacter yonginense TaxID=651869 RepID=A0A317EIA5_9SPHI|nr:hypothetical protein DHW03_17410 [Pedobacter yonginense]
MEVFIFYWVMVAILFGVGLIVTIIKTINHKPLKLGLRLMLIAVILVVIGAGACALILSNLSINH